MADLGEFGAEVAELSGDPDTFTFHGHRFTLPVAMSSLPILRFAWRSKVLAQANEQAQAATYRARTDDARIEARRRAAETDTDAMAALYEFLAAMLPGGQWEKFSDVAIEVGAGEDELLDVANRIMAAVAARPTTRSSGSPDGPSSSGPTSTGRSDSTPPPPPPAAEPVPDYPVPAITALEAAREELDQTMVPVGALVRRRSGR